MQQEHPALSLVRDHDLLSALLGQAPPEAALAARELAATAEAMVEAMTKTLPPETLDRLPIPPEAGLNHWTGLVAYLARVVSQTGQVQAQEAERHQRDCRRLERRFEALRTAYERAALIIELFYELIRAGREFQLAEEVLTESGLIILREFKADLVVCRMRREDGSWESVYAGSDTRNSTPLFVRFLEETRPEHPVMKAVSSPGPTYVISNDLRSIQRGGDSLTGEPRREGYRSRLVFILRTAADQPFALVMLYSLHQSFFDRYDHYFLEDCGSIVSLTVGRRLAMGLDALAKAAGGMAHVGNNVLSIMKNHAEMLLEEWEDFLDHEEAICSEIIDRSLPGISGSPAPGTKEAMTDLFNMTLDHLDLDRQMQHVNSILEAIRRLAKTIDNLLLASRKPVLMHYLDGAQVLDLEPRSESQDPD